MNGNNKFDISKSVNAAMLSLSDEEKKKLCREMEKFIEFAGKIRGFEYDEVRYGKRGPKNVLRKDEVGESYDRTVLLSCSKGNDGTYIIVPNALGGEE